jgi:hypothetical protein
MQKVKNETVLTLGGVAALPDSFINSYTNMANTPGIKASIKSFL